MKNNNKHVTLTCVVCNKTYITHKYRENTSKYCSKECWNNRAKKRRCLFCNKEFSFKTSHGRIYCSNECKWSHMRGHKAPAWKDGNSLTRERARKSNDITKWRKSVFMRDRYMCVMCGSKQKIHAHHIYPFTAHPELALDIRNGVTLCIECHGFLHNKDFSNRRQKNCIDCGKQTQGRSLHSLCRSCAIARWHASKKKASHHLTP